MAAVGVARMALTDAALAVLQARLARIQAGEDQPDAAAVDGHVPLHGRNPVSRHGPALAHGVTGEIKYVLTRKPRNTVRSLGIALASACSTWATCGCSSGTRTSSGCPTWACG